MSSSQPISDAPAPPLAETKEGREDVSARPRRRVRIVTAASLFDGHDAAINIMRRLLIEGGAEVIHLGHNRSAREVVFAAIQEDAHAIALSSYQGGHVEYFKYVIDLLKENDAPHIKVFGGGGGVIVPEEIRELEAYGVSKIYSPDDGRRMGLDGIISHLLDEASAAVETAERSISSSELEGLTFDQWGKIARLITLAEQGHEVPGPRGEVARELLGVVSAKAESIRTPIVGITGTGGAGKSSLVDELVRRFLTTYPDRSAAIIGVDPSKRRSGGALLGDRIRMNSIDSSRVYMRSLATRTAGRELSVAAGSALSVCAVAGFDLVILETSGIGQGDSEVIDVADIALYITTREFGAASQLEKIDMLDYADLVVLNKSERQGSADALKQLIKQFRRSRKLTPDVVDDAIPVFPTTASRFNDEGVQCLFDALMARVDSFKAGDEPKTAPFEKPSMEERDPSLIPAQRTRYLAEIASTCRDYRKFVEEQINVARKLDHLQGARAEVESENDADATKRAAAIELLENRAQAWRDRLDSRCEKLLEEWPRQRESYGSDKVSYKVRGEEISIPASTESLSGTRIPRVSLPRFADSGEILRFLLLENLPGHFPYTAGVFPFKRTDEDPRRQFAGEGPPERTNKRFHYLSEGDSAKRLSTAFDSVTPLRRRSGGETRHLRKNRRERCQYLHARRHEASVRRFRPLRSQHERVHDHQWTRAHHPRDVFECGHRWSTREAPHRRADPQ